MNKKLAIGLVALVLHFSVVNSFSQAGTRPIGGFDKGSDSPEASFLHFDDVPTHPIYTNIEIFPNRYAGVTFYDPTTIYSRTYVTRQASYSYPNSLFVGFESCFQGNICHNAALAMDFATNTRDISFFWGRDFNYGAGTIYVYGSSFQLIGTVNLALPGLWTNVSLSQYQQIRRLILVTPYYGAGPFYSGGWIDIDNFSFNSTHSPVGALESVSTTEATAVGWSADPDSPTANNLVHCHIDGQFAGSVVANLAGPGPPIPPYSGNHRFSFAIPSQYLDGNNHQISCYGIDHTGGDPNTLLTGSPKTFNIRPEVTSTEFVALPGAPLTPNNNPGGGLRIFPERSTPTGPVNNRVNVKARVSPARAGIRVHFQAYDLDDPWTDSPPLDTNGSSGADNRSNYHGNLCPIGSTGCSFDPNSNGYSMLTDANGDAVIPYVLTNAFPGDNYAVIATTEAALFGRILVSGIALIDTANGNPLAEDVQRTRMLTAWRTLHIERDSMGIIANSLGRQVLAEQSIRVRPVWVNLSGPPINQGEENRFENGRIDIGQGRMLRITENSLTAVRLQSMLGRYTLQPGILYSLCDDDDFNSDNDINGFDCDHGEDVDWLHDTFSLLQENDDGDCDDGVCNAFAAAYIQPSYSWGDTYATTNVPFQENNVESQVTQQINLGRNLNSGENDGFWVVYVQAAYQFENDEDCDPNIEDCTAGATITTGRVNDVANATQVPFGSVGSLIYIEAMRDNDMNPRPPTNTARRRLVPHEIGHQFGINGDSSEPQTPQTHFGLMGYIGGHNFIDRHLNVIRWRVTSPGT